MPVREILGRIGLSPSTYYNWLKPSGFRMLQSRRSHPDRILQEERAAVIEYALEHPDLRHRELAWRMVDEDVACLSPSSVYKILKQEELICAWEPKKARNTVVRELPSQPDMKWQSDISYIAVGQRKYYLLSFIDEHSRYIVDHDLLLSMDGSSVSLGAERALSTLGNGSKPVIQTDNGSCFISRDFKAVLSAKGVGHHRIRPHCPEENGKIERFHKTLKNAICDYELDSLAEARKVINGIIHHYNNERLHSSLNYLRPVDFYRGDPEKLLEKRKLKISQARLRRRTKNSNNKPVTSSLTVPVNHNLFQRTICPTLS